MNIKIEGHVLINLDLWKNKGNPNVHILYNFFLFVYLEKVLEKSSALSWFIFKFFWGK